MKVVILGDFDWESRLDHVLYELSDLEFSDYFSNQDYGGDLVKLVVGLICQDSELNLRPRIRLAKKEKTLYMDVMLDLYEMRTATQEMRKRIVATRLSNEVPSILSKYKLVGFDTARFIVDLAQSIARIGWL